MPRRPSLHYAAILTRDVGVTAAFYEQRLGMGPVKAAGVRGNDGSLWLLPGPGPASFALRLMGPPFRGWIDDLYQQRGPTIGFLSFLVEQPEVWRERLKGSGANLIARGDPSADTEGVVFVDPAGVLVELVSYPNTPPWPQAIKGEPSPGLRLHHVSITCGDLGAEEHFYQEYLGMETFYTRPADDIVFLADATLIEDPTRAEPTVELLGPASLTELNEAHFRRFGGFIDHISFLTPDVDQTHRKLSSKGVHFDVAPVDFGPNRIAFFQDPNGISLEIERLLWDERLASWRTRRPA